MELNLAVKYYCLGCKGIFPFSRFSERGSLAFLPNPPVVVYQAKTENQASSSSSNQRSTKDPVESGKTQGNVDAKRSKKTKDVSEEDNEGSDDDQTEMKEFVLSSQGSMFSKDGPAPFAGDILDHPDLLWTDDVWNEDKERKAQETIAKQGAPVSSYWKEHYETKAGRYWHEFYKRNQDRFYKDRHYLHIIFPELQPKATNEAESLLELGCGVGNAILPLLSINTTLQVVAMDFAKSAIDILRQTIENMTDLSKKSRITAFVNNLVEDIPPVVPGCMSYALAMFVLSAITPADHIQVFQKIHSTLKPGGKLFMRDYGRYDEAQLRFKKGSKLDDNFYVRQDGTCSYFFSLDELTVIAAKVGFEVEELYYVLRQYANRQQRKARYRVWIHAKFIKK